MAVLKDLTNPELERHAFEEGQILFIELESICVVYEWEATLKKKTIAAILGNH